MLKCEGGPVGDRAPPCPLHRELLLLVIVLELGVIVPAASGVSAKAYLLYCAEHVWKRWPRAGPYRARVQYRLITVMPTVP